MNSLTLVLSGLLLFQSVNPKPVIDNNRVRVWENHIPAASFESDTVVVTADGKVSFRKKGSPAVDAKEIISLKDA